MKRIALVGGSFNPPHVCHQMAALWVLSTGRADQVWLVPCNVHPFGKQLVAFEHRLAMCRLAAERFVGQTVVASSVEQDLDGDGRTLHTVEHLVRTHPSDRFCLVIGSDILAEREAWYRFDRIEELVEIVVVGRRGHAAPAGSVELPDVSSTEIRRRIAAGEAVSDLLPAAVLRYIEHEGLYRTGEE